MQSLKLKPVPSHWGLLAEAQRIGVVIDPISGEELQALAERIFATPAAVVERAKQAMEYKTP